MTFASKITVARLLLVPVFVVLAIYYAQSIRHGAPDERLRIAALSVFVIASASDALDGFIAKHFNQRSKFGAILDPIADKTLLLTGIITLSLVDWGEKDWRFPIWFTALVIIRDCVILGGIVILWIANQRVTIAPLISGKICTFSQMFALGWIMLRFVPFSPLYPCLVAGFFTVWSGISYFREGWRQLHLSDLHRSD